MGFQSSFNNALGIFASAALGAKHIKGQKESLAEQKMQGQFNVEREVSREQEQQEVQDYNQQNGTTYNDKNEMMAERAGQALASETNSKKHSYMATIPAINKEWVQRYIDWYGVNKKEAISAFKKQNTVVREITPEEREKFIGGNK